LRFLGGRRGSSPAASEVSFAKAFKRTIGITPGTYRGQPHGVPGLGRDPDAAILTQDTTGPLSPRPVHPS
jgi:hypothetical protein